MCIQFAAMRRSPGLRPLCVSIPEVLGGPQPPAASCALVLVEAIQIRHWSLRLVSCTWPCIKKDKARSYRWESSQIWRLVSNTPGADDLKRSSCYEDLYNSQHRVDRQGLGLQAQSSTPANSRTFTCTCTTNTTHTHIHLYRHSKPPACVV